MTKPFAWTARNTSQLIRMRRDGKSATQIANKLGGGVTRNAVLGKLFRLRNLGENLPHITLQPVLTQRMPSLAFVLNMPAGTPTAARPVEVTPYDCVDPKDPGLLRILDLKAHHCRWPLNNALGGEYFFCGGHKTSNNKPYCDKHSAVAYAAPMNKKRNVNLMDTI